MPVYVRHGDFRETITVQRRTDTVDAVGQPIPTWTDFVTIKAAAEPGRASELYAAAGLVGQSPMLFRTRYRSDIDRTMRVIFRDTVYAIDGDPQDFNGGRAELHIYAHAGATQG